MNPSAYRFSVVSRLMFGLASLALFMETPAALAARKGVGPSARQIIARMERAYAGCKSYQDTGLVKILSVATSPEERNYTSERPFKTAFVRSGRFRFEFSDKGEWSRNPRRYIVWRSGESVQTWWDLAEKLETKESLDLALAGATGISGGSAHLIPSMLIPKEVSGRKLSEFTRAWREKDGTLDASACFRVTLIQDQWWQLLWIDKKSYLVRRIDERRNFSTFYSLQTTTYSPIINEPVTDLMLEFNPPVKSEPAPNNQAARADR